ncbi:transient receptor potential cation channel subfamily V member 1-like [Haliotis cracherodii]|uniref:transient receptor potential cation channel subfamily V member 1-like n=1 Tax=Haliotis cracherodii TaxID=6455 RepID=UPI0039EAD1A1
MQRLDLGAVLHLTEQMTPFLKLLDFKEEDITQDELRPYLHELSSIQRRSSEASSVSVTASSNDSGPETVRSYLEHSCNVDFEAINSAGNTILHCITLALTEKHNDTTNIVLLELFDRVVSFSVFLKPSLHDFQRHKRECILHLTTEIKNNKELSVLGLAFHLAAYPVVERLMMMEEVMCTDKKYTSEACTFLRQYDITNITPLTNGSVSRCMTTECVPEPSCLERMLTRSPECADRVLDIPPVRAIEKMYNSVTTKIYVFITLMHIVYMSVFSYASCEVMASHTNGTRSTSTYDARLLFYTTSLIEPTLFTLYFLYDAYVCLTCKATCWTTIDDDPDLKIVGVSLIRSLVYFVYYIVFVCLVTVFVSEYGLYGPEGLNDLMSVTLFYGWLVTFAFAKGIQEIHFFLSIIFKDILFDVLKTLLVYVVILVAFTLALHSQFLVSGDIVKLYQTPINTMFLLFNVMMGMTEMWDGDLENQLEKAGAVPAFSKLLYIGYMVLVTIMLLNLLIAMMNKSYSRFDFEHPVAWRVEAIQMGINIERSLPWLSRILGTRHIRKGGIFDKTKDECSSWYIQIKCKDDEDMDSDSKRPDKEMTLRQMGEKLTSIEKSIAGLKPETERKDQCTQTPPLSKDKEIYSLSPRFRVSNAWISESGTTTTNNFELVSDEMIC